MEHQPAKMTPTEYAKYRSKETDTIVAPQNIYYYIRIGQLELTTCECGRRVLDVKAADNFFDEREAR
jgi:hypothetical protein